MTWQDTTIAVANIVFIFSLCEQIYENLKSKKSSISSITSCLYALGLYAMTYAMWSLDLTFSSIVTGINGILWNILFILSLKFRENSKKMKN